MPYRRSVALDRWLTDRAASLRWVAEAHALMGELYGRGRPPENGRPLAHAYIVQIVAEFQGFTRDLHELAAEHLVLTAAPPPHIKSLLAKAVIGSRAIDSGNATMAALRTDFARLGLKNLESKLAARYAQWDSAHGGTYAKRFNGLLSLRNAIAHGNRLQVEEQRRQGRPDTVSWARAQLPLLTRTARALDEAVWEHLLVRTEVAPW